jgi:hypothetical protein
MDLISFCKDREVRGRNCEPMFVHKVISPFGRGVIMKLAICTQPVYFCTEVYIENKHFEKNQSLKENS